MNTNQSTVAAGLFGANGSTVSIRDTGAGGTGKISAGDTVVIRNAQGVETKKVLSQAEAYDVNFRSNVLNAAKLASDPAWDFTEKIVEMPKNELNPPEVRTTQVNGQNVQQKVLARDSKWEVLEQRGDDGKNFQFLKIRSTDDNGNPVKPSDAINDLFANKDKFVFDCATPVRILNLKAQLDTVGADDFDAANQGLALHSHFDSNDKNGDAFDSGFDKTVTLAAAGNADGATPGVEFSRFNPSNDRLVPGEWRYFEGPGDDTTSSQGTNRIYLGPAANGKASFYEIGGGIVDINLNNPPLGEYLSSLRGSTPTDELIAIDQHVSA